MPQRVGGRPKPSLIQCTPVAFPPHAPSPAWETVAAALESPRPHPAACPTLGKMLPPHHTHPHVYQPQPQVYRSVWTLEGDWHKQGRVGEP